MRVVLQRVQQASVRVNGQLVADVGRGFLLLVGVEDGDTQADATWMVEKILKLRLFADEGSESFMEKSIVDVRGEILAVSQFTLLGDCRKGTRPSFSGAARPEPAKALFEEFLSLCRASGLRTETGMFGQHMSVSLINDGPVTLILDSRENQKA